MRSHTGSVGSALLLLVIVVASPGMEVVAREGTLAEAVEAFNRQEYVEARRVLEGIPDNTERNGTALYYLGRLALIDGRPEEAVECFEQVIDIDPENSEYHHWLATAETRRIPYRSFMGKMSGSMKALKEFRKAIELDPANLMARMTLFQMMVRSYGMPGTDTDGLREEAQAIAEIDSVMGHVAHGTFFQLVEKDMGQAGAHFERGYALAPQNRAAAISYADYLWETGRRDEALGVLRSFVESVPEDKPAHFNLAARLTLSGSGCAKARDVLEVCLGLKSDTGMPSEPMVRWCLGLAHHLLGDEDRARAEWSKVYELDEDFDQVVEAVPQMTELRSILAAKDNVTQ